MTLLFSQFNQSQGVVVTDSLGVGDGFHGIEIGQVQYAKLDTLPNLQGVLACRGRHGMMKRLADILKFQGSDIADVESRFKDCLNQSGREWAEVGGTPDFVEGVLVAYSEKKGSVRCLAFSATPTGFDDLRTDYKFLAGGVRYAPTNPIGDRGHQNLVSGEPNKAGAIAKAQFIYNSISSETLREGGFGGRLHVAVINADGVMLTRHPLRERNRPQQELGEGSHKPGRNEPCPCGSGRKHKRCCGANEVA